MKIRAYNKHFAFIDSLIRKKATGTPVHFGQKLGISARQAKRIINELKEDGFPVAYCFECQSYYYTEPVKVRMEITVGNLDLLKITGGACFCFLSAFNKR